MSYEFHVNFRLELEPWDAMEERVKTDLRRKLGRGPTRVEIENAEKDRLRPVLTRQGEFTSVKDLYACMQLLGQTVGVDPPAEGKRPWNTLAKGVYAENVLASSYTNYIKEQSLFGTLGFVTPCFQQNDLARLPVHSFFLCIPFTLSAPYISKDDASFYVHENPVRKDPVLRVPVVGSTSWKGSFRAALRWTLKTEDDDARVIRLLGNPKEEKEDFRRGRLSFYPTFFDALEVQVINPHSRETGAGTQPIYIESVPRNAEGIFALLYTPIIPSKPDGPLPDWNEVLDDLENVEKAIYSLLVETGFGAKISSGMGRAKQDIHNAYLLMHHWVKVSPLLPSPPPGERPSEQFQPDSNKFLDEEGRWLYYKTNEELKKHISGEKACSQYKRQRTAYRTWQEQRDQWQVWEQEVARLQGQVERRMIRRDLSRLDGLKKLRQQVEEQVGESEDE